jgi:hypothetical protein
MEAGFTLDSGGSSGPVGFSHWVDGAPERSVWTGLKLKDRVRLAITTWRCPKCGLLESYANDPQS